MVSPPRVAGYRSWWAFLDGRYDSGVSMSGTDRSWLPTSPCPSPRNSTAPQVRVIRIFSWPILTDRRTRPTALDILISGPSVLIASPAAGGIVDIDRASGESALLPLEADAGTLLAGHDAVRAVASPDWYENQGGELPAGAQDRQRLVVWEEPDEAETARYRELSSGVRFGGRHSEYRLLAAGERATDGDDRDGAWLTAADWMDADGDGEEVQPPTPIWRISAGAVHRIDADAEQPILVAAGNRLAGVARLPGDPVIKHIRPGGSQLSYGYPGTAIVIDEAGTLRSAGALPGSGGVVCESGGRVWLLGFDDEIAEDQAPQAREVLLDEDRLADPLDIQVRRPVAVVDSFVVDIGGPGAAADGVFGHAPRAPAVRFLPIAGGEPWAVELPGLGVHCPGPEVRSRDGEVWFGNPGASALMVAAPGRSGVRQLYLTMDIRPWLPRPQLAYDVDPDRFEQDQLDQFRRSFLAGPPDQRAEAEQFIEGVCFDSVELRGEFPDSEVVATFRASDRPGIRFARRWRLYDELGNPCAHEYAGVYLQEDILAGNGGLPALDRCVPDADGLVWFRHPDPAAG
jgi:hypothetical protein